ncbi:hypothetical protein [Methylobacterium sp. Leaf399]|uniref:hypothetical protein n=1 Tax=Methylobacterium sp. Leaf399 TaxID=1736364 RepID=UPI0012E33EB7|nr:hypothetical protein [Methylobacterium sp. Leaf399]
MKFSDLEFKPHRRAARHPGKTHARAVFPNGETVSVVFTPSDPSGPNDEPYEVLSSNIDGESGDGIFYCATPDDVQTIMDRTAD